MKMFLLAALFTCVAGIKQNAASSVQLGVSATQQTAKHNDLIMIGVGALVVICAIILIWKKFAPSSGYKTFGDKSGLSTSSSDITSSETGSTDRELKSRMERFEKRLEDHKKMLETRDPEAGSSSITDSESKLSSSVGGGKPMWFNKK